MTNQRNKYSLSRRIDPEIMQKLRTEVNYVCPARDEDGSCNDIFLTWHHFDPPFREWKKHEPKGMIALCNKHHARADADEYSLSQLKEWKKNPNISNVSEIKTKVSFLQRNDLHINIANTFLAGNYANIICQSSYIRVQVDENGLALFNVQVTDSDGKEIFYLRDNVFNPTDNAREIEAKPRSLHINVKGKSTNFQIYGKRITEENYEETLREEATQYSRRIHKILEGFAKVNKYVNPEKMSPDVDDVVEKLKAAIKPDNLLIFLKGKIYFKGGYADLDNAFQSSDGSAIIAGLFARPDVEIGSNFVAAKNL